MREDTDVHRRDSHLISLFERLDQLHRVTGAWRLRDSRCPWDFVGNAARQFCCIIHRPLWYRPGHNLDRSPLPTTRPIIFTVDGLTSADEDV
jgi:hypothetical protein